MLRIYINLFLSLLLPTSLLFSVVATFFHLRDVPLSKAIQLGLIVGIPSGIGFSLILALIITIKRAIQIYRYQHTSEEKLDTIAKRASHHNPLATEKPANTTQVAYAPSKREGHFLLLMEYDVAFEVILFALRKMKIGIIQKANKRHGEITVREHGKKVLIHLSRPTPHTTLITVEGMKEIDTFIDIIKEKEFAFLEYVA